MSLNREFINYQLELRRIRKNIFLFILALSFSGALLIYDASSVYAWFNYSDPMYFFKRQVASIILGIILVLGILKIDLDYLKKYSKVLLFIGIGLLALVLFFGVRAGGARRWLRLFGWGIQPSEFMKFLFLIYISDYIYRKKNLIKDFFRGLLPLLIVAGITCLLIFMEPDFGTAVFFAVLTLVFLFIGGIPRKYIVFLFSIFSVSFLILIVSSPYRMARIFSYLNPWSEPQGRGFQLIQSQIGLGSGGLLGIGLGESKQKLFFLPAAHTDFIFSIIGEELGFVGTLIVLGAYLFIFFQGLKILNWVKREDFCFYLGWGSFFVITFQALVNISVVVGILPTKGLPLPFLSYGGSSLLSNFILLGLFLKSTKEAAS